LILALELYFRYGRKQLDAAHPDVIALSAFLKSLPIYAESLRGPAFRNPNGVAMKLGNLSAVDPDHAGVGLPGAGRLDREVFAEFAGDTGRLYSVAAAIKAVAKEPDPEYDYETNEPDFPEGRLLTRRHLARERNPTVVRRKKAEVLKKFGRLACECCGFDFAQRYGKLGGGFAECHHTAPVSTLKDGHRTRTADLAIVCANCHRMLHRARPMLTIAALKELLAK
jgi:5-methylcytosine-specific restriction enzyme A